MSTDALGAVEGDLVLIAAGPRPMVRAVLGQLRLELGRPPLGDGGLQFLWVVDFPLFEAGADGQPIPMHHPFTMPHPEDIQLLDTDPLAARAQAYDLVLNGWELGSGSVRIHRPDLQQRIFSLLGIEPDEAQARFGFLLDAFRYGAPPHAGFAVGIDRLVAILSGEENIREVIAFPKTQSGSDPLTGAPTPIDATQLRELGLPYQVSTPQVGACRDRLDTSGVATAEVGLVVCGDGPGPDLFAAAVEERLTRKAPLAARLRPRTLDEVVGQKHLLGPGKPLRGPHRVGPALVADPVGAAGHGQDHDRPPGRGARAPRVRDHARGRARG